MKKMTPANMAAVCAGERCGAPDGWDTEVTAITTDSRNVTSGSLFVAIKGERTDGHAYLEQAIAAGAVAILGETLPEDLPVCGIRVPDPAKALQPLAAYYLDQLSLPRVGISGSSGKTSTKEMIAAILSERFRVLKTEGNFNNELGVPLTIFRIREEDEIAVIEMGINHFGEMDRLATMVRPDTMVLTNIGTAHLEFLGTPEGIRKAKTESFAHLTEGGRAVLNGDDVLLREIRDVNGAAPIRFGIDDPEAEIRAEEIFPEGLSGSRFVLCMDGTRTEAFVPSPGIHAVYNALAGAAVGRRYGMRPEEIVRGMVRYQGLPGRLRIRETESLTILDDCYNANPSSMKASLSILGMAAGRRVAILGDMGELGEEAEALHREVGKAVAEQGVEVLLTVGEMSRAMQEAAAEARGSALPVAEHFADRNALSEALPTILQTKDTVLVKASHFMGLEEVVRVLEELSL